MPTSATDEAGRPRCMLEIDRVFAGYGGPPIIRGVSARVGEGEIVTVVQTMAHHGGAPAGRSPGQPRWLTLSRLPTDLRCQAGAGAANSSLELCPDPRVLNSGGKTGHRELAGLV